MFLYFTLFYSAFLLSLGGTWCMIRVCQRYNFFDTPGSRKIHSDPVPTLGGIPIAISFILMLWFAYFIDNGELYVDLKLTIGLSLAGFLAIALGVYDDLKGSTPLTKLLGQTVIALVLFYFGFSVEKVTNPFGDYFDPSWLKLPITVFWVLVITNAINLIDGLDGLAAGVVLFSSAAFYFIVALHGGGMAMYTTFILCGAILGFLRFNFYPAKIFLGDTGSIFLGVCMAAISIVEERKGTVTITLMLPIVIMAVPIVDAVVVFVRRLLKGNNPFHPDRGHIHHRLLEIGFTQKQVVLVIYGICLYLGLTALLLSVASKQFVLFALLILAAGFFIAMLILKYFEDHGIKVNDFKSLR